METGEKKRKNRVETSVDVLQRDRSEKVIKGLHGVSEICYDGWLVLDTVPLPKGQEAEFFIGSDRKCADRNLNSI